MTARWEGAALAVMFALAASACAPPGAPAPSPSPSAAAAAKGPLGAADTRFYSGDYEGAEAAYRALATSDPAAYAHLAVLLAYETRLPEAVAAAKAGVAARSDSTTLAALTRAYDWSNDLDGALDAGARAVAATPVDPLAHLYYSEVLADAGRFDESEAQIRIVDDAPPSSVYARAELYREWANFYRDNGDPAAELNNIQLSVREQAGFPERRLELARHQYLTGKTGDAHATLSAVTDGARSHWVMVAAGDAGFLAKDPQTARSYYQRALELAPGDPYAEVGAAAIDVEIDHNLESAHTRLVAAVRRDPTEPRAYEFLKYLDKVALKRDPAQDLAGIAEPPALAEDRKAAIDTVNGYRAAAGLAPLTEDRAISEASEAHAWYTVFNFGQQSQSGLGIHTEDPSLPGFTGANGLARDRAAGWNGTSGAEVINHAYTAVAGVRIWIDSVFHRFPLLSPDATVAGFGEAEVGVLNSFVMDVGLTGSGGSGTVVFPADGATGVPLSFVGNEIPDPAPKGTEYPVGYPVTLAAGSGHALAVRSIGISGPDGQPLEGFADQPGRELPANEVAAMALHPLKPGTRYTVAVSGTLDGAPFSRQWSFTTAGS